MKRIILALLFISGTLFSQTGASFKFGDILSWWTPKVFIYGNSTYWHDSTNYQTTNKSVYIYDSLKVGKDLYVGVKGGVIYLDTNRSAKIEYSGNTFKMTSSKSEGGFYFDNTGNTTNAGFSFVLSEGTPTFGVYKYRNGQLRTMFTFDSTLGLTISRGDVQFDGTNNPTGQIKIPSDTVSDYDANDAVTLNRQSGIVTTKSLTTAADADYTITLTNSLISATTKVIAVINTNAGTGAPIIRQCASGSGSATIIIRNLGAGDLNSAISFHFVIFN